MKQAIYWKTLRHRLQEPERTKHGLKGTGRILFQLQEPGTLKLTKIYYTDQICSAEIKCCEYYLFTSVWQDEFPSTL